MIRNKTSFTVSDEDAMWEDIEVTFETDEDGVVVSITDQNGHVSMSVGQMVELTQHLADLILDSLENLGGGK